MFEYSSIRRAVNLNHYKYIIVIFKDITDIPRTSNIRIG